MGKKKFIEKKQSATYRLFFKESSSAAGVGEGTDRVFVRVDGGDSHVPGFDLDTEEDEHEQEEHSRGGGHISDNVRQEMLELGFPDDGYNYLQHLREVGTSGRIGSFVPNNRVRLDALSPDVKAFDASKVRVPLSVEEIESNALNVSGGAHRIRGPVSKVVDSDVATLLDKEDDVSLVSGDELEDDFVALANEGAEAFLSSSGGEDCRSSKVNIDHWDAEDQSEEEEEEEEDDNDDDQHKRPTRFLDEQFELLALREYDDDEIGELDDDDFSARGPAHISKFNNIMSDFLINSTFTQDKYQTPAEVKSATVDSSGGHSELTQSVEKAKDICSLFTPGVDKGSILVSATLEESISSDEEKELVLERDSDSDEGRWDCESIVTTYSTLDNHPGQICSFPKVSSKSTRQSEDNESVIRLRGKQQIPLDYLPKRGSSQGDRKSKSSNQVKTANVVRSRAEETKEEKKTRKAAIKEEKRSARALKKDMKLMYKDESQRAQRTAAFTGPATLHLG